jgi:hypothetical protein
MDTRSHIRDIYDNLPEQVLGEHARRHEDSSRCAYVSHNTASYDSASEIGYSIEDELNCPKVDEMLEHVHFLSEHMKKEDEENDVSSN